ncbi:DUF1631 domain-containing protein [Luteimonas soli]|uniref:DUF1631 domain-containing protein n=1 Tax=Luteimonas soli TaxID=1648966 RepID=A0ABV7XMT3_9GAMM
MSASTPPNDATPRTLAAAGLPRRVRKALEQALSLVSVELDDSLGTMLKEFEQELFRLADLARTPGVESNYMQTLRTLRMNRADLIPRFMLELEAGVAAIRTAQPPPEESEAANRVRFQNLSLVEDEVMDEGAVLREVATRQESRAALPLHLLGQRFGVLAGSPAFDAERIPLGPRALCRAMRDASQTLQVPYEARLLLYRIFDRQVMAGYSRVLERLDEAMDAAGVLPGLTFVPVRARATAQGGQETGGKPGAGTTGDGRTARTANAGSGDGGGSSGGGGGGTSPPRDGHANDRRAAATPASTRAPPGQPRPHTAWMGESWDDPDGEDEQASLAMLQQLMAGRHALIGKLRPHQPTGPRQELSTRDVFQALGELQNRPSSPNTGSSLQDIKQTLLAQARQQRGQGAALSQKDNDTFELISMLYGQIEEEIRSDAPGAALIRRLQLPLLRVALQDRAFFVRGHHPARRLLNTVAESAAKWLDKDDYDPQMLLPLQQAVTHVVENYDGDDAVFDASNGKLETHLQEQVRKAELLERRHVEAARGKEKLEVAKLRATQTLDAIIGDQRLAKFVRALLNQAWADVLTLTLLRQGEGSDQWRTQVEATQRIVAACCNEDAPADPALTTHVAEALGQVGYHADEAGVIAQRLTSRIPDDEDDPASRTELAIKLKARARLGEDPAKARRPKLPPRTPEEQARYEQLRVMPFGTWIEFVINQQGDLVRRRLSWFSPVTDNALFVNQRGQRVGEHSIDSLARMVAAGQARIVTAERGRLVDRAWQAAVSALRSFAGRGDEPALLEPK